MVDFDLGELGVVTGGDALVAEAPTDLVDALHAADEETLEVKLGGDAQEEVHVEGVVMGDEGLGGGAARDLVHHGGLDLEVAGGVEVLAQERDDVGALDEEVADVGVGEEVDVTLAIAGFDVGEPVPLFGRRGDGLGQERERGDEDGGFAGAGACWGCRRRR